MSVLIKENTIFEEVEKKCNTFVNNSPVMDKYKKREIDAYFFDKSIKLDLQKAEEKGTQKEKYALAKNMKNENLDINLISRITGLSIEEIIKL